MFIAAIDLTVFGYAGKSDGKNQPPQMTNSIKILHKLWFDLEMCLEWVYFAKSACLILFFDCICNLDNVIFKGLYKLTDYLLWTIISSTKE